MNALASMLKQEMKIGLRNVRARRAWNLIVLLDDTFASIITAVDEGRSMFQNIRTLLTYGFVHKVAN